MKNFNEASIILFLDFNQLSYQDSLSFRISFSPAFQAAKFQYYFSSWISTNSVTSLHSDLGFQPIQTIRPHSVFEHSTFNRSQSQYALVDYLSLSQGNCRKGETDQAANLSPYSPS